MDAIVAGLGALGSAAAWALAERGRRVVGLDRFRPPHDRGSSHGRSRVIREAYFEGPLYVPLVRRAFEGWERLERRTGRTLLRTTGALMVGPEDGTLIRGTLSSVRTHDIPHRLLSAGEMQRELPGLAPEHGMVGVWEERAGVLQAEGSVEAMLEAARRRGAELHFDSPLLGWEARGEEVVVRTPDGEHRAGALILAVGPWMTEVMGAGPALPLDVTRQVVHWFGAGGAGPVTVWEYAPEQFFYTVPEAAPEAGGGVMKAALHYGGEAVRPDEVDRTVHPDEAEELRGLLERYLPGSAGTLLESSACLYATTPDHAFVLGRLPDAPRVVVLGGGSGHAFKFAPALGEAAAELVLGEEPSVDLEPFSPARFVG